MTKTKGKNNESKSAYLIGILFLISSAMFGVFIISEEHVNVPQEGQSDFSSLHKPNEIDTVNDHLRSVTNKMELERMKAMVANLKASRDAHMENSQATDVNPEEPIVNFGEDPRVHRLAEDLGRANQFKGVSKDPRSVAYEGVIQKRKDDQLKQIDRKRQAEAFVAKALKDGWVVRLDSEYKIKSYYRVEEPQTQHDETEFEGYTVVPK